MGVFSKFRQRFDLPNIVVFYFFGMVVFLRVRLDGVVEDCVRTKRELMSRSCGARDREKTSMFNLKNTHTHVYTTRCCKDIGLGMRTTCRSTWGALSGRDSQKMFLFFYNNNSNNKSP